MSSEKLTVKCPGGSVLGIMTKGQAERIARKTADPMLLRAGFVPIVVRCTKDINGWDGYRIAYGRK